MKDNQFTKSRITNRVESRKKITSIGLFLICAFVSVVVVVTLLILILPDRQMSEKENRVLAQKPVLTLSSITSGKFMTDFES